MESHLYFAAYISCILEAGRNVWESFYYCPSKLLLSTWYNLGSPERGDLREKLPRQDQLMGRPVGVVSMVTWFRRSKFALGRTSTRASGPALDKKAS